MSNEIIREEKYCSKLASIAHIEKTYAVSAPSHRLQPTPPEKIGIRFHCHDCFSCGVGKFKSETSASYDWESCPEHSIFKKRGTR